jgi:hypothetical protein
VSQNHHPPRYRCPALAVSDDIAESHLSQSCIVAITISLIGMSKSISMETPLD